jgi:hypothetical protein
MHDQHRRLLSVSAVSPADRDAVMSATGRRQRQRYPALQGRSPIRRRRPVRISSRAHRPFLLQSADQAGNSGRDHLAIGVRAADDRGDAEHRRLDPFDFALAVGIYAGLQNRQIDVG